MDPTGLQAYIIFNYNTTLAARSALGDGMTREEVASQLESLAAAIRTQDCAENMSPISTGILGELL